MKVLLAQINPTVGDLLENKKQIIDLISQYSDRADLLVFPEMSLLGYPPQDLLFESRFISEAENCLNEIAQTAGEAPVILGTVRKQGAQLFNSAAILQNGKLLGYRDKSLLPTYDVFDEDRYFSPSSEIKPIDLTINGNEVKLGIEICEDLWDDEYATKVTNLLCQAGSDLVINISASPFSVSRLKDRIELVREKVAHNRVPFVYCNLIGAQDELVFDGRSFAVSENGTILGLAAGFKAESLLIDLDAATDIKIEFDSESEEIFNALTLGVKDYFKKSGHDQAVIGLSGGVDSALVAAIAAAAVNPEHVLGITMPSRYSSDHSISDSEQLAENLGIKFLEIPIKDLNNAMLEAVDPVFHNTAFGIAEENIQARLRGNILMAIANKKNALVLNTGNKTETALGYCTMYGDMCGALGVISDLNKIQVYDVCRWINENEGKTIIPEHILTKAPSAELRPDQVDPFDYEEISPLVDDIIMENKALNGLVKDGYDESTVRKMLRLVRLSEYKRRQAAPGIRISSKAFGIGRRYPIINRFRD